nr:Chain B, MaL6 [synthetic construct]
AFTFRYSPSLYTWFLFPCG